MLCGDAGIAGHVGQPHALPRGRSIASRTRQVHPKSTHRTVRPINERRGFARARLQCARFSLRDAR
jgi:hypothetical protein